MKKTKSESEEVRREKEKEKKRREREKEGRVKDGRNVAPKRPREKTPGPLTLRGMLESYFRPSLSSSLPRLRDVTK